MNANKEAPPGKGVRQLKLVDQLPDCRVLINSRRGLYDLAALSLGKVVLDVGCGYGRNRAIVEDAGGKWIGVEPFEGGGHTVVASADALPFADGAIDVVVMDAVLEHLPEVEKSFAEVARVLKPGGYFVGYVAFMECFHEISYSHLSFKALEYLAGKNGLRMESVSGGGSFGIDYHTAVLLYPIPFSLGRVMIAGMIRGLIRIKSILAYVGLRIKRGMGHQPAWCMAGDYYKLECLRQSVGFSYVIRKVGISDMVT